MKTTLTAPNFLFSDGGGEMCEIIRTIDWEKSSLGRIETWPISLCTTLGILLHSDLPMFLLWGKDLNCFYNDAFRVTLGVNGRHSAIGKKGGEIWPEVWKTIGPAIQKIFNNAQPISLHDQTLPYHRKGRSEETFWTYRCNAAFDDNGKVNGVLVTCTEAGSRFAIEDQRTLDQELEKQLKERTSKLVLLNENLKKSEQRYHIMIEEVQDYAIIYLNRKGIIENWNAGAEKIKGYKAQEIIGKNFSNFYTEKDRKNGLHKRLLRLAAKQNKAVQEGWRVRKDNSLFWASVVITAIHNEKNEVIGFTKVTHDLTEKKEFEDALKNKNAELEQKNAELEKLNKELEAFTYISSHDLQEPLRKIRTFASRILEKDKDTLSEKGKYLFQRMQLSAERMQVLINDLLTYSHIYNFEGDLKKTDLNVLFEKTKQKLSEELEQKNALIEKNAPFVIRIIPFQFEQIFFNLLSNSIKFSRPEVPLQIKIVYEFVTGTDLQYIGLKENTIYGHIAFSDNGIGFDQNYNDKIFELFQRLHGKDKYPGTGIGLAIIKRIIENHKGAITAKGKLGEGSTFNIYIPTDNT